MRCAKIPVKPTNVQQVVSTNNNSAITISWDQPSFNNADLNYTEVWLMEQMHKFNEPVGSESFFWRQAYVDPGATSYSFPVDTAGLIYQFKVRVWTEVGPSPWSDIATGMAAYAPSKPVNLAATGGTNNAINIVFDDPLENGGQVMQMYKIEISNDWTKMD